MQNRISALDKFRYLTVTFALCSHIMLKHQILDILNIDSVLILRSITRTATPALIVLFGVMLEVVYFRRYQKDGKSIFPRLVHRALLCYIAFILLAFILFLQDGKFALFLTKFGFLSVSRYADIFVLYFFWLLLAIPLLKIRLKYQFLGLLPIVIFVGLIHHFIIQDSVPAPRVVRDFSGFLVGWGNVFGPSVVHGLYLIFFGMLIGNVVYKNSRDITTRIILGGYILLFLSVLFFEIYKTGFNSFFHGIIDMGKYRSHNQLVYFAYGAVASLLLIGLSYLIEWTSSNHTRFMNKIGSSTFSYYFLGNVIILLSPLSNPSGPLYVSVYFAAYITVIGFFSIAYDRYLLELKVIKTLNTYLMNLSTLMVFKKIK